MDTTLDWVSISGLRFWVGLKLDFQMRFISCLGRKDFQRRDRSTIPVIAHHYNGLIDTKYRLYLWNKYTFISSSLSVSGLQSSNDLFQNFDFNYIANVKWPKGVIKFSVVFMSENSIFSIKVSRLSSKIEIFEIPKSVLKKEPRIRIS